MRKLFAPWAAGWLVAAAAAAAGQSPDHPGQSLRDRLVSELRMTSGQVQRLDAAFDDVQPSLDRMQDLEGDERRKVLTQLNTRISAILTPAQRPGYEHIVREAAAGGTGALVRQLR